MNGRHDYLDALRGLAALGVFIIHAGGMGLRQLGAVGNTLADLGKHGVTLFFVVSAFSLCLRAERFWQGERGDWSSFYVRRFFRIWPLYLVVLVYAVQGPIAAGADPGPYLKSLAAHLSFANIVLLPYANNLLSVEWTIPVEVSFYLVFPALALLARWSIWPIVAAAVLLIVPSLRDTLYLAVGGEVFHFRQYTLFWHLYAFLLGIIAYHWRGLIFTRSNLALVLIVGLIGILLARGDGSSAPGLVGVLTALVIMNAYNGGATIRFLSFRPLCWVGTVSFSVYLLHVLVLEPVSSWQLPDPAKPFVALAVTLGWSVATYWLIEKPGQALGKWLLRPRATVLPLPSTPAAAALPA